MQATPIKIDVSNGFRQVTLLVADFTPFLALGKPVELTVGEPQDVQPPKTSSSDASNVIQMGGATSAAPVEKLPPNESPVTGSEPFTERPTANGMPLGAANAENPNACPLCYGHGLVREFRGEADTTGTTVTCKTCGGTGIKPAEAAAAKDTGPIKACTGCDGSGSESPGKRCQRCDGTGIEPANPPATHDED